MYEPLSGGYPVVGIISVTGADNTSGWALLISDQTGAEVLESGTGPTGPELTAMLVDKAIVHAEESFALIRTWREKLTAAVLAAGGEMLLDVQTNIRDDDEAYLAAVEIATELAGLRRTAEVKEPLAPLVVAVDGSRSRTGAGSWAWITEDGKWRTGVGRYTSSLQAELIAINAALQASPPNRPVHILCDSRDAIRQAARALAGHPSPATTTNAVARTLAAIARDHRHRAVTFEWVKGHAGHPLNDRADRLAVHARRASGSEHTPEYREVAQRIAELEPQHV